MHCSGGVRCTVKCCGGDGEKGEKINWGWLGDVMSLGNWQKEPLESFSSFLIPNQESKPRQEEIDVVFVTNDVLPLSDDNSHKEVDAVGDLRVDNFIQNSEHEYSESKDSDFDNPLLPLPPQEPPDNEFDFEIDFKKKFQL
nr:hypothetical protein [Tanacetum cinerariifolium]GEX41964.1 hypothetical protein [Tanacetum cinerariifolium]